jgi:hypothetical protein
MRRHRPCPWEERVSWTKPTLCMSTMRQIGHDRTTKPQASPPSTNVLELQSGSLRMYCESHHRATWEGSKQIHDVPCHNLGIQQNLCVLKLTRLMSGSPGATSLFLQARRTSIDLVIVGAVGIQWARHHLGSPLVYLGTAFEVTLSIMHPNSWGSLQELPLAPRCHDLQKPLRFFRYISLFPGRNARD